MARQHAKSMLVRQWRLMELVRSSHQGRSIQALMKMLNVSKPTLDRDLSILEEAGVPLKREEIAGEAWLLYREDTVPLSEQLRSARGSPSIEDILNDAIQKEREVYVSYTFPGTSGVSSLTLAPLHIRAVDDISYLLSWDRRTEDWRLLEVPRITAAQLGDTHDEGYRFNEYEQFDDLVANRLEELITVAVRLTPYAASMAYDYPLSPTQVMEPQPDHHMVLRCQNVGTWDAVEWVLRWGREAEVIAPNELREKVASELRRSLHKYLLNKISELTTERESLARTL